MKHLSLTVSLAFVVCNQMLLLSQETTQPVMKEHVLTKAGELKVLQLDKGEMGCKFSVALDEKVILKTDCESKSTEFHAFPIPSILASFNSKVSPYDEIVVLQQSMWGNACGGGPVWVLGLKTNGSFKRLNVIDYCGDFDVINKQIGNQIFITLHQSGIRNKGFGYFPQQTWIYENGLVKLSKTIKKGQRRASALQHGLTMHSKDKINGAGG